MVLHSLCYCHYHCDNGCSDHAGTDNGYDDDDDDDDDDDEDDYIGW